MFVFTDPLAHAGLTVAAVLGIEQIFMRKRRPSPAPSRASTGPVGPEDVPIDRPRPWRIDYRLVIIGSLLPDLIDKPLGLWVLPDIFSPSLRGFAHTLLFNTLLIVFALAMLRFRGSWGLLVLALASAGHLLIDMMWESPWTLFWPAYGIGFKGAESDYTPDWLYWARLGTAKLMIDAFGAMVLVAFFTRLHRRRGILNWLRHGP